MQQHAALSLADPGSRARFHEMIFFALFGSTVALIVYLSVLASCIFTAGTFGFYLITGCTAPGTFPLVWIHVIQLQDA